MKGDNKINLVIYFTGFAVWFILFVACFLLVSFFAIKSLKMLLMRPYYCINHLFPYKWWSEKKFQDYSNAIEQAKIMPKHYADHVPFVELKRKNNFVILIDNYADRKWYQPKHHFIYIKGVK